MTFLRKASAEAKKLPKAVWIAAVIIPFGLTIVGTWIAGKSVYENRKKNRKIKD